MGYIGSPLGPKLANAFMCHYEKVWLEECPSEFNPTFYRRYVDDIFVTFSSSSHVEPFLRYLNSQHNSISFTCEEESDNKLPFLDVNISGEKDVFTTNV